MGNGENRAANKLHEALAIMLLVSKEYVSPMFTLKDTQEDWAKWQKAMDRLEFDEGLGKNSFYGDLLRALVDEAVVPGRVIRDEDPNTYLSEAFVKYIMNDCYKTLKAKSVEAIPELLAKYSGISFAERVIKAFDAYCSKPARAAA